MTRQPNNKASPWYRQFWPWLIIAILGWGIVSSAITLTVAVRNPPQMMDGDYAQLGKLLVDTHLRADRARELGLKGRLSLDGTRWWLDLDAHDAAGIGDVLVLLIRHPVDSARDRQTLLRRETALRYTADAHAVPARGRIIVSDPAQTWWISGSYDHGDGAFKIRLAPERL